MSYCQDNRLDPVAYTSRSASRTKANYAVTDLETVAAVTHFQYYAAVRAMLRAPNLSGKHARWWNKVYYLLRIPTLKWKIILIFHVNLIL